MITKGGEEVNASHMLSIAGKLIDLGFLVPDGKFPLGFILAAASSVMDKAEVLNPSPEFREECRWWILHLQAEAFKSWILRCHQPPLRHGQMQQENPSQR